MGQDAEYLEQGWLLLADLYINQGKFDVASDILATTLRHNQVNRQPSLIP